MLINAMDAMYSFTSALQVVLCDFHFPLGDSAFNGAYLFVQVPPSLCFTFPSLMQ